MSTISWTGLHLSAAAAALMLFATPVTAQTQEQHSKSDDGQQNNGPENAKTLPTVVVTGSRIRRSDTTTAAPVVELGAQDITDFGFVSAGQLLNEVTSNTPSFPVSPAGGFPAGNGKTYPNLFNLGSARTLTLVNGHRMVTSSSGLGAEQVDTNIIPVGLVERVDVVQGGGAVIYGSGAIAGVVNYILKDHYEGAELGVQYSQNANGNSSKSTPSFRATFGRNFDNDRGNIAVDLEYSKTQPFLEYDSPATADAARLVPNPANTSVTDGISPTKYVFKGHIWGYNRNGVIYGSGFPFASLLRSGGSALQFSSDGKSVIPYHTGSIQQGSSTAVGGQGLDARDLSSLIAGVKRWNGTVIGHYDLTDNIRVSGSLLYAKEASTDPYGTQQIFRLVAIPGGTSGPIRFNRTNPFLTQREIDTLSAASPTFASGGNLYLGRFLDILPTRNRTSDTDTRRGLLDVSGNFQANDHYFYWTVSASYAKTNGTQSVWAPYYAHEVNALDATRNSAGDIVCAINDDAITSNDDPACAPLNPFGSQTASAAARDYVSALSGEDYQNVQTDYLATLGGDLIELPGGWAQFSVAYEHRSEKAQFTPFKADLLGLTTLGTPPVYQEGSYHTNEFSGELQVPLIGDGFTLPAIQSLDLNASYRLVKNSIAGTETIWGAGLRWDTGYGITFRGSYSQNFRAPTLNQLFRPTQVASGQPLWGTAPCDVDHINGGPDPTTRLANCKALFAAHPEYGPLEDFHDPAKNTGIVTVTTKGNPDLKNELSTTKTVGLVFQPNYIPGLTLTADQIDISLKDGLSLFSAADFVNSCYDSSPQPKEICDTFTRNAKGWIVTAQSKVFNAAKVHYRGQVYNLNYRFPLSRLYDGGHLGILDVGLVGTHTTQLLTSVTGTDRVFSQGTVDMPSWRSRFDLRYSNGPFGLFYSIYHLPSAKSSHNATIETTAIPVVAANNVQTISARYNYNKFTFRVGVNNLTNEMPSFPTRAYGDIFGRRFFVGMTVRL